MIRKCLTTVASFIISVTKSSMAKDEVKECRLNVSEAERNLEFSSVDSSNAENQERWTVILE